jgi:hypothetical protein
MPGEQPPLHKGAIGGGLIPILLHNPDILVSWATNVTNLAVPGLRSSFLALRSPVQGDGRVTGYVEQHLFGWQSTPDSHMSFCCKLGGNLSKWSYPHHSIQGSSNSPTARLLLIGRQFVVGHNILVTRTTNGGTRCMRRWGGISTLRPDLLSLRSLMREC